MPNSLSPSSYKMSYVSSSRKRRTFAGNHFPLPLKSASTLSSAPNVAAENTTDAGSDVITSPERPTVFTLTCALSDDTILA